MANASDTIVVIGPEHGNVFDRNGWDKKTTVDALYKETVVPAGGDFGMITKNSTENQTMAEKNVPKFRNSGITLIRAGGSAGLFFGNHTRMVNEWRSWHKPSNKGDKKLMQNLLDPTGELEPISQKPFKKLKQHQAR